MPKFNPSYLGESTPDITLSGDDGADLNVVHGGTLESTAFTPLAEFEPAINPGTTGQFWCGDKSWRAIPGIPSIASTSNVLKGDGAGNAVAATPGTDFASASQGTKADSAVQSVGVSTANGVSGSSSGGSSPSLTLTLGAITPSSVSASGSVSGTSLSGTLQTSAQPNVTSFGTQSANLLFTDSTYDIGASGATRPRDLFLARYLRVGPTPGAGTIPSERLVLLGSAGATDEPIFSLREGGHASFGWDWLLDDATTGDLSLNRVVNGTSTKAFGVGRGTGTVYFNSAARLKVYTVSTLPAGSQGDTAAVSDALTPTFLAIVVGGGSTYVPVTYNGTNWVGY